MSLDSAESPPLPAWLTQAKTMTPPSLTRSSYALTPKVSSGVIKSGKSLPNSWQPLILAKPKSNCYPKRQWQEGIGSNPPPHAQLPLLKPNNLSNHSAPEKEPTPLGKKSSSPSLTGKPMKTSASGSIDPAWKRPGHEISKSFWILSRRSYPTSPSLSSTVRLLSLRAGNPLPNSGKNQDSKNHQAR